MAIGREGAARRLAQAILGDIRRYRVTKLPSTTDPRSALAEDIAEGRALFDARVEPDLRSVFDSELAAFDFRAIPPRVSTGVKWLALAVVAVVVVSLIQWKLLPP